jgi:putative transposase
VSDARRLRSLADENAKLKRLLAEAMLDSAGLKDLFAESWRRPLPSDKRSRVVRRSRGGASGGRVAS